MVLEGICIRYEGKAVSRLVSRKTGRPAVDRLFGYKEVRHDLDRLNELRQSVFLFTIELSCYDSRVSNVTRILEKARQGDSRAAEELLPLVYQELRKLAAAKMAREAPGQTLQPTALVHEAWLRLGGDQQPTWENSAHFFGAAAEAMRRILVERARAKKRLKRGGGIPVESLSDIDVEMAAPPEEVLQVDSALDQLAAEDSRAAEVVKLRYFVGLPVPRVAEILNTSPRTVDRLWAFARVRLMDLIEKT